MFFPYQQAAGFLACRSSPMIHLPKFPQWRKAALTRTIDSLLTVTRSHRSFTCFPFNLRLPSCPRRAGLERRHRLLALFNLTYCTPLHAALSMGRGLVYFILYGIIYAVFSVCGTKPGGKADGIAFRKHVYNLSWEI